MPNTLHVHFPEVSKQSKGPMELASAGSTRVTMPEIMDVLWFFGFCSEADTALWAVEVSVRVFHTMCMEIDDRGETAFALVTCVDWNSLSEMLWSNHMPFERFCCRKQSRARLAMKNEMSMVFHMSDGLDG